MTDQIKATLDCPPLGDDLAVVNAAKVSFGRRSTLDENGQLKARDRGLINFLARGMTSKDFEAVLNRLHNQPDYAKLERLVQANRPMDEIRAFVDDLVVDRDEISEILNHWRDTPLHKSPFNQCYARFVVEAPITVARQLVKHEYMPFNEMSGRYIEFPEDGIFIPEIIRRKVEDKKQGSGEPLTGDAYDDALDIFEGNWRRCYREYQELLDLGVCEEQARGVLPLHLMTQWVWSGSLGAISKMAKLRLAPDAQYESRLVAEAISGEMQKLFPVSWQALMTNGVN